MYIYYYVMYERDYCRYHDIIGFGTHKLKNIDYLFVYINIVILLSYIKINTFIGIIFTFYTI